MPRSRSAKGGTIDIPERGRRAAFLAVAADPGEDALRDPERERLARMGAALRRAGFSFDRLDFDPSRLAREKLVAALRERKPDLVHCSFYDRGLFESLAREKALIVGSPASALELASSKSRLKRVWDAKGIANPSGFSVRRTRTGAVAGRRLIGRARDYPYIVKPDGEDENRGIHARSIAFDAGALAACIDSALEEYDELVVERFIGGASSREYTVAMIGNGERALMLPAEIRLKGSRPIRVVTREDRERGLAEAVPVEGAEGRRISAFARRAIEAAGARDYARCDLIEEGGSLFALEVNGQPRIPDPWFEACARGAGLDPEQYIAAIALAALWRGAQAGLRVAKIPDQARGMLPTAVVDRILS
jgi:D-alanine-D-alanine ligase-like ATP-grasp enzyme